MDVTAPGQQFQKTGKFADFFQLEAKNRRCDVCFLCFIIQCLPRARQKTAGPRDFELWSSRPTPDVFRPRKWRPARFAASLSSSRASSFNAERGKQMFQRRDIRGFQHVMVKTRFAGEATILLLSPAGEGN